MEGALQRFRAADTQVLGASIDSVYSHANWAKDLGGVSFPLLSDFEPKGAVARSFGHYLQDAGIADRATVIVDKQGIVRYSVSVTPAGQRDAGDLLGECQKVNAEQPSSNLAEAKPLPKNTVLYVKSHCGHSRAALLAVDNLRLVSTLRVINVSEDPGGSAALEKAGGKNQAPCLVLEGRSIYESSALIQELAEIAAPLA